MKKIKEVKEIKKRETMQLFIGKYNIKNLEKLNNEIFILSDPKGEF
ncbi:hypothetical protein P5F73_14895 [Clostridium perfringens]|nr:hypothetical protein [Clostridium perfringens]